ncbi:hypothetical protein [Cupriavidus sp. D39]|uniref:hypothetical protein n=1 Tax=Cupriavidus sp. D39 TaxID=2997877 RepID=UPI002270FA41|nr:hypothetical protein [Cupriavidus sp. D39]MCY0856654.1 hypothetical protein [Cupriavidus sp. D39]
MPVESRLEQAYALCLERQPNVIAYRTQAIEIAVPGKRSHWPDFLILDDQGRLLVRETKQDTAFLDKDYREKTDWVRGFLYRIGIDYAIVGRADLPTDRELQNLKVLHQSYTRLPGKFEIDHATAALPALLPCTYQALIEALGDVGKHLLFTGQLRIDWQKPFNMNSEVWK